MGRIAAAAMAATLVFSAVPAFGQNSTPEWEAAVAAYKQQRFRQAISDFQHVVESHPEFPETYFFVGLSHFRLKEYGKSIVALTKYVNLSEKAKTKIDPGARAAIGRAYLFTDNPQKAVTALTIATQQIADDAVNFFYLGVAYQKLKETDKAIAAYSGALKINAKDTFTLDALTRLLIAKAVQTQAPADFQAAIARGEQLRLVRDDAPTAMLLGSAYLNAGEFAKASVHFGKATTATPKDPVAWFNYGLSLSRSDQFAKAEPALLKAVEIDGNNADILTELGYVQESLKKYAEAQTAYEKAHGIRPSPQLQESIDRCKLVTGG